MTRPDAPRPRSIRAIVGLLGLCVVAWSCLLSALLT